LVIKNWISDSISERIWRRWIGFLFLPDVINLFVAEIIYYAGKASVVTKENYLSISKGIDLRLKNIRHYLWFGYNVSPPAFISFFSAHLSV
jgi:hypothetical protein